MTDDVLNEQTSSESQALSVLDTMVGEGQKYATNEALAVGRQDADKFIEQLKFENEEMRKAMAVLEQSAVEAKTIDQVLTALDNRTEGTGADNQDALTPEAITSLVNEALTSRDTQAAQKVNYAKVNDAVLADGGGDPAVARANLVAKLSEVKMSNEDFVSLSKANPVAALRILNVNKRVNVDSLTQHADINPQAPPIDPNATRNNSFYNRLRKEMGFGKYYADVKLQKQAMQDAADQGADFYK